MQTIFAAIRSAVFAAAFFWLWTWIALLLRAFDPVLGGPLPPWTASAGFAILSAGAVLALSCIAAFIIRGRGTLALFETARRFVAVGLVRNPMYLGGAVLMLLFHLLVVLYEARTLHEKFGPEYNDYCRRTPRWIPQAL